MSRQFYHHEITQLIPFRSSARPLDLSSLASEHFTTFSHPAFPGRSARIKKSKFCDGGVAYVHTFPSDVALHFEFLRENSSYTGYVDVGPKHFFFYFFESRSDPDKDDVILWTNGGPGGSSALGLFMELGENHLELPPVLPVLTTRLAQGPV